jgi:hypothetical protein
LAESWESCNMPTGASIRGTLPTAALLPSVSAHPIIADLELAAVLATAAWQRGRRSLWMWAGSEALAGVAAVAAGVQFPSTEAPVVGTVRRIEQDDARSVGAQQVVGWSNSRPVGRTRRATPYDTW